MMPEPKGLSPKARRKARQFALQAIYQWSYTQDPIHHIETQYLVANEHHKVDWSFFSDLVRGMADHVEACDAAISQVIDRDFSELTPIECCVLRLAVYELLHRLDVPYQVVLNEYIELEKAFGNEDGHKYINGVLDKLATTLRVEGL